MSGANLAGADLTDANLLNADLSGADLSFANLNRCVFQKTNLRNANFYGASTDQAYLIDSENLEVENNEIFCSACVKPYYCEPKLTNCILPNIYFELNRYDIMESEKAKLNRMVSIMKIFYVTSLMIEGYSDAYGTIEYGLALADKRANNVKIYLNKSGIEKSRMTTIAYDEQKPFTNEVDLSGINKNRGVSFAFQ